jgi:hypothetical protein
MQNYNISDSHAGAMHDLDRLMSSEVQGFENPETKVATLTNAAKEDIEKLTKSL